MSATRLLDLLPASHGQGGSLVEAAAVLSEPGTYAWQGHSSGLRWPTMNSTRVEEIPGGFQVRCHANALGCRGGVVSWGCEPIRSHGSAEWFAEMHRRICHGGSTAG